MGQDRLETLYEQHALATVRLVGILLGDPDAAVEVVHDAFVRIHGRLDRLRDPSASAAYLRSTALNLARNKIRREQTARRRVAALAPASPSWGADHEVLVADDRQAVLDALRSLPDRQRECLVLRHYLELSDTEIAATLSISASSVKTHLQRGTEAVARLLKDRQ
jgi:RNA polymerase sigma factor (sigma-70 family)